MFAVLIVDYMLRHETRLGCFEGHRCLGFLAHMEREGRVFSSGESRSFLSGIPLS